MSWRIAATFGMGKCWELWSPFYPNTRLIGDNKRRKADTGSAESPGLLGFGKLPNLVLGWGGKRETPLHPGPSPPASLGRREPGPSVDAGAGIIKGLKNVISRDEGNKKRWSGSRHEYSLFGLFFWALSEEMKGRDTSSCPWDAAPLLRYCTGFTGELIIIGERWGIVCGPESTCFAKQHFAPFQKVKGSAPRPRSLV